ncbi:MAG: glucose 1-dehydrogenase [Chloroflexi bacterium]|nr:glucose 1-dehydrogenase [Chloroflexota bacterium]
MEAGVGLLGGKTVIVTGGGHGIGRAYCLHFGREGASVVVADLDGAAAESVAEEVRTAGGRALGLQANVASWDSARTMATRAVAEFGAIHGLVNNAAIFATIPISRVGFEEIDEDEWDRVLDVNTKGVWLCCRAVVPSMRRAGGGSIVNIASGTVFNGNPTRLHYVASKAAVVGITRVLARELGDDNIRVNTIAPGNTLSEDNPSAETVAMRANAARARALKRVQRPEDVVGAVAFFLSDDAAFITGQTLIVDGGNNLH